MYFADRHNHKGCTARGASHALQLGDNERKHLAASKNQNEAPPVEGDDRMYRGAGLEKRDLAAAREIRAQATALRAGDDRTTRLLAIGQTREVPKSEEKLIAAKAKYEPASSFTAREKMHDLTRLHKSCSIALCETLLRAYAKWKGVQLTLDGVPSTETYGAVLRIALRCTAIDDLRVSVEALSLWENTWGVIESGYSDLHFPAVRALLRGETPRPKCVEEKKKGGGSWAPKLVATGEKEAEHALRVNALQWLGLYETVVSSE